MERKWTLKMHFFGVLKSYEFLVKIGFGQDERHPKNRQFLKGLIFFRKHVLSQPMVLFQRELDLWGLRIDFFGIFGSKFKCFFGPRFSVLKRK